MSASGPTLHQPLHSKVSNYLNDQRRTGQFCDLIIEIENGATETKVFGHFCVIGAQSKFIGGTAFQQAFSIQNPLELRINDFHCSVCLQIFVDFCYEDVIAVSKEHEDHFRELIRMLGVTELLTLYDMDCDMDVIIGECKNVADVDVINTKTDTADEFHEQRSYFKLQNPRPLNGSNKINYCIGCDFTTFRVADMVDHMSSCEASHMTCSLCEIGFLSWREYDAHLRKHSVDMKKPFFCLECSSRFITRAALMVHQPKHTTETPHRCNDCGKGFKWKHGLANHLLIHSKEKLMLCDVCGYSTTHMKALKSHKLKHTEEYFTCPHFGCKHTANRKENLKLHIETHKQERPFVCEICGCKFSQNKNLKRHALKHSVKDSNRHQCHLCPFASHRSDKLREHLQRVHTEKAIQLELPEIVENAFESRLDEEYNLPFPKSAETKSTMEKSDGCNETQNKRVFKQPRKNKHVKNISSYKERFILPKS